MTQERAAQVRRPLSLVLSTACAALFAIATATGAAAAQGGAGASTVNGAELEHVFWICDHGATNGLLGGDMALTCSLATEELKATRFGGDFDVMLAWWRANKQAQHQALEEARRVSGPQFVGRAR